MPLARVLACGHTAPLDQDCPVCGPTPAKRAESARKRSKQSYIEVYSTPRWRALRLDVLQRDHFRCQDCGAQATVAAHTKPFSVGDPHVFDPAYLKASCVSCNSSEASQRWHATKETKDASEIQETGSPHGHGRSRQEDTTWAY